MIQPRVNRNDIIQTSQESRIYCYAFPTVYLSFNYLTLSESTNSCNQSSIHIIGCIFFYTNLAIFIRIQIIQVLFISLLYLNVLLRILTVPSPERRSCRYRKISALFISNRARIGSGLPPTLHNKNRIGIRIYGTGYDPYGYAKYSLGCLYP